MSGQEPGPRTFVATGDQARRRRNQRIVLWAGIAVLLAAIVAAAFWFSSAGDGSTTVTLPRTPEAAVSGNALVVGDDADAPMTVTVYEDYRCTRCRDFEQASRDYLHQDAAAGRVLVEYRPFLAVPDHYSRAALTAWAAVLNRGTPAQALRLHDLLYDEHPTSPSTAAQAVPRLIAVAKQAGAGEVGVAEALGAGNPDFISATTKAARAAGVRGDFGVVVNGKPITGADDVDGLDVAERLETIVARS